MNEREARQYAERHTGFWIVTLLSVVGLICSGGIAKSHRQAAGSGDPAGAEHSILATGSQQHYAGRLPAFESEDEEREFWATHDSTEYLDWDEAEEMVLPKLKPSTRTISLRLPESMLNELRLIANKRDVPYQSLIKIYLKERIDAELKRYVQT
jgi:predicted DNA binding CopG/RHH family protein